MAPVTSPAARAGRATPLRGGLAWPHLEDGLTWRSQAVALWPHALWISGDGRFASVANCGPGTTVVLHASFAGAEEAKRTIDRRGCGADCKRHHEIIDLDPGGDS